MKSGWRGAAAATTLSLATALASCGPPPAMPPVHLRGPLLLRLVPPEGQVSRYAYSMETNMENPMMPSTGPLMTMRFHQTQTVLSVEHEVIRSRGTIDSTATTMAMAMPGMDIFPDFSGSVFTTEMDTRGGLLGVVDTEGLPVDAGVSLESMFEESNYFVLPEEEASPGDSWTLDAPMSLPMEPDGTVSMDVELTYSFVSLEGSLATLSFEGPIDMNLDVGGMGMSGSGTMTGPTVVDLGKGRFESQTTWTNLDMSMGGMTMKMSSTTTLELLPDP